MATQNNDNAPDRRNDGREGPSSSFPHIDARPATRPSVAGSRRVHGTADRGPRIAQPTGSMRPVAQGDTGRPSVQAGAEAPRVRGGEGDRPATRLPHPRKDKPAARHNPVAPKAAEPARDETGQSFVPLWDDRPLLNPRLTRRLFIAGGAAAAAALLVFGVPAVRALMPISITANGQKLDLSGKKTLQAAYEKSGLQMTPGNLVDVEGQVITEGGGSPYRATINGQEAGGDAEVADGDVLAFADGADVEEPSVTEDKSVEPNPVESGYGPIHAIDAEGSAGLSTVKTGETSGKEVVLEVKQPSEDRVYLRSYPDTGGEAVVALTFDDGPWEGSTSEILDILRDNGAAATFFTVGNRIAGAGVDLVKREHDEGHQICTHSWDHAAGSGQGVNLSFMSVDEQRAEIEQGLKAISDATGAEASRVIRAPGGNFPLDVWRNVEDLIDADIGWDIDTLDWKRPGAEKIAAQLKAATPGDIILMHDGGGDRSQTAEALRRALPYLKDQGFRFITMDEMLRYPRKQA